MSPRTTTVSIAAAGIAILLIACQPEPGLSPGEGYVEVPGGQVWYRIAGSGQATPLLVLHGGPGFSSYYLKPLAALGDERPVVFYDQLGAGHSEAPTDTTLWRVDRFVRELALVREALGLGEVHILGHSWGSMLAVDYMLTQPTGVRSLVLASPLLSASRWLNDADGLKATLPDSLQAIISHHEASGTTDAPEYQGAVMEYYRRYLARKEPWSADIDSTFAQSNPDLYGYMWGPSEFAATGTLKDYDRTDKLPELGLPVLFTAGRYDEATPSTVAVFQSQVPGAELAILEASAHLTMQDEPEEYVRIIRNFLRRVEQQ
jgi:proline iminopeptidase